MSIAIMSAVWRMTLPPSDKMVLLALADAANDEGLCWVPMSGRKGKQGLRQKTSLSERCIQNCISRLVALGHLSRDETPGKGVIYEVHPRTECTPAQNAPPQQVRGAADAPAQVVRETPAAGAPEPILNPSPPSGAIAPADPPKGGSTAKPNLKTPIVRKPSKPGSRLPDDWEAPAIETLPQTVLAIVKQWPAGAYEVTAFVFKNHWLAEGRAIGAKRNWPRTWENWLIREAPAIKRAERSGVSFSAAAKHGGAISPQDHAAFCEKTADFYDGIGRPEDAAALRREASNLRATGPPELALTG